MSETLDGKSTTIVNTMDQVHEVIATPLTNTPENEDHKKTLEAKTISRKMLYRIPVACILFVSFAILVLVNAYLGVAPNVPAYLTMFSIIVVLTWLSRCNGLPFTKTLSEEDSLYRFEKSSQRILVHIGAQMGKSSSSRRDSWCVLDHCHFFWAPAWDRPNTGWEFLCRKFAREAWRR